MNAECHSSPLTPRSYKKITMRSINNQLYGVLVVLLLSCICSDLTAQQLPARSPFAANNFLWNPAMTAVDDYWEAGVTHQQEWVGFDASPQTTNIFGAYPFQKENFSLGGYLQLDEIAPLTNNTLAITYAYHLEFASRRARRRKGPRKEAQLSLGIMLGMQQTFLDGSEFIVRHEDDPLEPIGELNEFTPNVGFGVFFASRPTGAQDKSYFYAGAAANQLLPQDITLSDTPPTGNLERAFHGNATIGYRSWGSSLIIEPSLWFNLAGENISNSQFNLTIEKLQAFWGGISYSFNQTMGIQVGYSLPGGFTKDDVIRIGMLGSFNMGSFGAQRGLGYGFYLAYRTGA